MMGLPNWLRGREGDLDMTRDDEVHVPEIAKVEPMMKKPLPFHIAPAENPNDEASVVMQAHQFVEQWKLKDATQQQKIEQLESDIAELRRQLQSEQRKSGLLELDIVQQANNLQTLQTDLLEKDRCLSLLRQVLDKFGTKAPPKPERKPKPKKKAEREAATETPKTDG